MKKLVKYIFCILSGLLLSGMAFYLGLALYYRAGFSFNTWINDVYCTGKSVEEANQELIERYEYSGLTIYDNEGRSYQITSEEIDIRYDFESGLSRHMAGQNPYLWIENLFQKARETVIEPEIFFDEEKLKCQLEGFDFIKEDRKKDGREVKIVKSEKGYMLINERIQTFDFDKAFEMILLAVERGEPVIDLGEGDCFVDLPLTPQMEETLKLWDKIHAFQNCHIVYRMGEDKIPVDASVVSEWICVNEKGEFLLDEEGELLMREEGIPEFIESLAEEYDTMGGTRTFLATSGKTVTIEGGTYGNKLDQKAEIAYLQEAFRNKVRAEHTPSYLQMARKQGKDDIGDTYIEIDMEQQMMYYYEEGECLVETPVVTGNLSRRWGTPSGVNYVYAKQTNRVLRGEGYASPVKYWIPVKGNIGIHDASWRKEFGGEIYKTSGSHGCINTPYDEVSHLYELVEIGTPCVMF